MRRCVSCRRTRPQGELLRFARNAEGTWRIDLTGQATGRGHWVCKDTAACWQAKRLAYGFRAQSVQVSAQLTALTQQNPPAPEAPAHRNETPHSTAKNTVKTQSKTAHHRQEG